MATLTVTKVCRKGQTVFGCEYEITDGPTHLLTNYFHMQPEGANAVERRAQAIAFAQQWLPEQCAKWTVATAAQRAWLAAQVGWDQLMTVEQGWVELQSVSYSVSYTYEEAEASRTYRVPRSFTDAEKAQWIAAKNAVPQDTATMDALTALRYAEGYDAYRWELPDL